MERSTEKGNRGGRIVQCITGNGRIIWPTGKGSLSMPMGIRMKETGWTIRQMGMGPISMQTMLNTWANGLMTCSMDKERSPGLTEQDM